MTPSFAPSFALHALRSRGFTSPSFPWSSKPPLNYPYSFAKPTVSTMVHVNGATKDRSQLVPFNVSRLEEGRAIAQDVWSIFK